MCVLNCRIHTKYLIMVTRNLCLSHIINNYMVDTICEWICNQLFANIFFPNMILRSLNFQFGFLIRTSLKALLMGRDMLSELEHLVVNLKSYVKDENRKHVSHSINIMWVSLSNPSFDAHIPLIYFSVLKINAFCCSKFAFLWYFVEIVYLFPFFF